MAVVTRQILAKPSCITEEKKEKEGRKEKEKRN
jgi:hypothetical protein